MMIAIMKSERSLCWVGCSVPSTLAVWYWRTDPLGYIGLMQRALVACEHVAQHQDTAALNDACSLRFQIDVVHLLALFGLYIISLSCLVWFFNHPGYFFEKYLSLRNQMQAFLSNRSRSKPALAKHND